MNGRLLRDWSLRERAKARAVLPQETALGFPLPVFEVVLMGRSPPTGNRARLPAAGVRK